LELEQLLNGQHPSSFSAAQLAERAQNRWDRGQLGEAAVLFEAAAEAASRDSGPDRTIVYVARAAMTRHLADDRDTARQQFEQVIRYDWAAGGPALMVDSHVVEWAFAAQLEEATDWHTFKATYARAVARCAELGWGFPRIHPKQDLLVERAVALGCDPVVEVLLPKIEARRSLGQAAKDRVREIREWLEARRRARTPSSSDRAGSNRER
jgi:hypothetical protein